MSTLPLLPDEELAVGSPSTTTRDTTPEAGLGALRTERGCLPLRALNVHARIDGLLAQTEVHQTFVNVHDVPLEATYLFPLPDRAAVTRFQLEVAGRIIEGTLKERGEARQEYDVAIRAGHRAAITEEERPGVFTLRVGNLPPGEEARVTLTLAGPLPFSAGEATFQFPLVVAPRYIPGTPLAGPQTGDGVASDTTAVPDASRISPPVLLPGFPNPVDLSIRVDLLPSQLNPHAFRSSLHAITDEAEGTVRTIRVQPGERLNRDFILRFRVGTNKVQSALSLLPDAQGNQGTFLLTIVPPEEDPGSIQPRDVVFVLDRSGSMGGWKMVAARRALGRMVDTLTDRDRFGVLAFDNSVEFPPDLGDQLISATNRHRYRAVEFLARIDSRGGTEMAQPLHQAIEALTQDGAEGNRERILVLITDGQVGNESQLLQQLGSRLEKIRVFTLGIDRAVNAGFLRRLAEVGRGMCELVESEDRLDEVMAQTHRFIATPVLTEVQLRESLGAGARVLLETVVPSRVPDLFAGAPLFLQGRYQGPERELSQGALTVRAREANGQAWTLQVPGQVQQVAGLASIWARARVRDLEDRYLLAGAERAQLEKAIIETSLRFGVLSRFTAYLAVDRSETVNEGGVGQRIVQPVESPADWEMAPQQTMAAGIMRAVRPACLSVPAPACAPPPQPTKSKSADRMSAPLPRNAPAHRGLRGKVRKAPPGAPESTPTPDDHIEAGGRSGWLDWLLGLFDWGKKKGPLTEAELHQRGAGILEVMKQTPTDTASRWTTLRALADRLQELHRQLAQNNSAHPVVAHLSELLARIRALANADQPDETRIQEIWAQMEQLLRDWLPQSASTGAPPASREGFWKS